MLTLLLRLAVIAASIWIATKFLDGIKIVPADASATTTALVLLGTALVFSVVNHLVKPVVQLLSLPFVLLTLGLFLLVINALMLMLTAWLTSFTNYGLSVSGFFTALVGSVIISISSWAIGLIVPKV